MPDPQIDAAASWFFQTVGPEHMSTEEQRLYQHYQRQTETRKRRKTKGK